jgi:hypothetical protein
MLSDEIKIKYVGGPTALFEAGGVRFLTDPTFDLGVRIIKRRQAQKDLVTMP